MVSNSKGPKIPQNQPEIPNNTNFIIQSRINPSPRHNLPNFLKWHLISAAPRRGQIDKNLPPKHSKPGDNVGPIRRYSADKRQLGSSSAAHLCPARRVRSPAGLNLNVERPARHMLRHNWPYFGARSSVLLVTVRRVCLII